MHTKCADYAQYAHILLEMHTNCSNDFISKVRIYTKISPVRISSPYSHFFNFLVKAIILTIEYYDIGVYLLNVIPGKGQGGPIWPIQGNPDWGQNLRFRVVYAHRRIQSLPKYAYIL